MLLLPTSPSPMVNKVVVVAAVAAAVVVCIETLTTNKKLSELGVVTFACVLLLL